MNFIRVVAVCLALAGSVSVAAFASPSVESGAVETQSLQNASWWPVQAQTWVSPYVVTVTVTNYWAAAIGCRGQVYARTYYGGWGYLDVFITPILPGVSGYAYLNPTYGDAFIAAHASVYCTWL